MEQQLLCQLYQRYAGELSLYLYSLCADRELAEDLLQEVFLKAMLSLSPAHTNFRAWLYRVGRNLCFNEMRRRKWEQPLMYAGLFGEGVPFEETSFAGQARKGQAGKARGRTLPKKAQEGATAQTPLALLLKKEEYQRLHRGIWQLAPVARQIIVMQYFGGLSQKEIGAILGLSAGNVRIIAFRARAQLREFLQETMDEKTQEV